MLKIVSSKVHTSIGHQRALCGVNPERGNHRIVSNTDFLFSPNVDRCKSCLLHLARRGQRVASQLVNQQVRAA